MEYCGLILIKQPLQQDGHRKRGELKKVTIRVVWDLTCTLFDFSDKKETIQ